MPAAFFFLLKIALAVRSLLCYHMNFRVEDFFFYFNEGCHWYVGKESMESIYHFG